MKPRRPVMAPSRARQRGLSLVELMIAIALGLMIIAGLTYTFIAGRQSYRMQDNLSRIQENARAALDSMARDLRMAGYIGCAGLGTTSPSVTPVVRAKDPPLASFTLDNVLTGYDSGTGWTNSTGITQVAGSDVLTLHRASGGGAYLSAAMTSDSAAITIASNPDGFATNDVLLISDCSSADIFRASEVSGTSISHVDTHNSSNSLSKAYGVDARVMGYQSSTYFIGTSATGAPTLYRQPWDGGDIGEVEELAEYVEDMQLTYGVDTDSDDKVNEYVSASEINDDVAAAPNWDQVKTVRIRLLVGSPEDSVTDTTNTHDTLSGTASDRRLHRIFSMTVSLRNRLP